MCWLESVQNLNFSFGNDTAARSATDDHAAIATIDDEITARGTYGWIASLAVDGG